MFLICVIGFLFGGWWKIPIAIGTPTSAYGGVCFCNNAKSSSFDLAASGNEEGKAAYFVFEIYSPLIKKYLQINNSHLLKLYAVDATNKEYEFWQRNPRQLT